MQMPLSRCVNVSSKAVFSDAMTIKDKIHGWVDEGKRGGIQSRIIFVDRHRGSVVKMSNTEPSNGRVSEGTNVVHLALHQLGMRWLFR